MFKFVSFVPTLCETLLGDLMDCYDRSNPDGFKSFVFIMSNELISTEFSAVETHFSTGPGTPLVLVGTSALRFYEYMGFMRAAQLQGTLAFLKQTFSPFSEAFQDCVLPMTFESGGYLSGSCIDVSLNALRSATEFLLHSVYDLDEIRLLFDQRGLLDGGFGLVEMIDAIQSKCFLEWGDRIDAVPRSLMFYPYLFDTNPFVVSFHDSVMAMMSGDFDAFREQIYDYIVRTDSWYPHHHLENSVCVSLQKLREEYVSYLQPNALWPCWLTKFPEFYGLVRGCAWDQFYQFEYGRLDWSSSQFQDAMRLIRMAHPNAFGVVYPTNIHKYTGINTPQYVAGISELTPELVLAVNSNGLPLYPVEWKSMTEFKAFIKRNGRLQETEI